MDRFAGKPRSHRLIRGKSQATKKQPVGCFFLHRKLDLSQFFLDASCFTGQVTQVVQLGFTYVTATLNGHAVDLRAVGLESTLYANTVGDFTNSESTVHTTVTLGDYHAFERLQTRTVAFLHFHLNDNSAARGKGRDLFGHLLCFECKDDFVSHAVLLR